MSVAAWAALVSCSLCATLKEIGETEQRESKDTDGEANEQHGRYCIRKNDCRKPRKPLNEAMCVEQELQDAAQAQPPVQ